MSAPTYPVGETSAQTAPTYPAGTASYPAASSTFSTSYGVNSTTFTAPSYPTETPSTTTGSSPIPTAGAAVVGSSITGALIAFAALCIAFF
ncbi:hypothetical protein F4781DRAFT_411094 [Annulohypoxylon bovei var. microspora]|nr:hypothetical protein F4781DRAFT_411094 [Annulohypoxylon bovei var. microspora]